MATVFNALARIQHLPLLDAARSLASAGVPVFPCVPREKRPLTRRGFHDATTDLDQVSAWWDRWPSANIAIPTGPASGIEVVDIDIGSTGSGFPAFQRACQSPGFVEAPFLGFLSSRGLCRGLVDPFRMDL